MFNIKIEPRKISSISILLILTATSFIAFFTLNSNIFLKDISDNKNNIKSSPTTYISEPLDITSDWWNSSYGYRLGFIVEENDDIGYIDGYYRYQPIDVFFPNFNSDEHYDQTTRLVRFNATGKDEWSEPIPIEVWNVTYQGASPPDSNFIQSCTITFIANVTKSTNSTYYLYYNEDMTGIEVPDYSTGMSIEEFTVGDEKRITITVDPPSGSEDYTVAFDSISTNNNDGIYKLEMDGVNFHLTESNIPEKYVDNMEFLAHFEETDRVVDYSGMEPDGEFGEAETQNSYVLNGPERISGGVIDYCLDFDAANTEIVTWNDDPSDEGMPWFSGITQFTIMGWINPGTLSDIASNHNTENPFMSHAGDSGNDNFELGIEKDANGAGVNYLHLYLDTLDADTQRWFGSSSAYIRSGIWNFFAVTYDAGDVDVYIYNQYGEAWFDEGYQHNNIAGGTDDPWDAGHTGDALDQAPTPFAIGGTHHGYSPDTGVSNNVYYNGLIDEVSMFSTTIPQAEIEDYKTSIISPQIETIETLVDGTNGVMAKYNVTWKQTFDMHVNDIITFYYDYNLYNIHRTIWFESFYDPTISTITTMKGYYNVSGSIWLSGEYYHDGQQSALAASNTAEDYFIIRDQVPWDAFGLFIANYTTNSVTSSISYLNGSIAYETSGADHYMIFSHGSNNDFDNNVGGPGDALVIDYWEYADKLTGNLQTSESARIMYFNNISLSLKNPLDTIYMYGSDNKFYGIEVNVTDIDVNPVPFANVTLYNSTDGSVLKSQLTDTTGITTFTRLEADTYELNVTYHEDGYYSPDVLEITSAQTVTLSDTTVGSGNINKTKFENVQLTSLNVTCRRSDGGAWQEFMDGAQIDYSINNGSGLKPVGSISADENGKAIIRWYPLVAMGNLTFNVSYAGFPMGAINTTYSIDHRVDLTPLTFTNITLPFFQADVVFVNASSSTTIETALDVPTDYLGTMIRGTIEVSINFTFSLDSGPWQNVTEGTVSYRILEAQTQTLVSAGTNLFTELANHTYYLSLDTSLSIPGTTNPFKADVEYEIEITASKPSYPSKQDSVSFQLTGLTSRLIGPVPYYAVSAYWGENLNIEIKYEDIHAGIPYTPISGAVITYEIDDYEYINHSVVPFVADPTPGWYNLTLNTADYFPSQGIYVIEIKAYLQGYQIANLEIVISVNPINTKLNGLTSRYTTRSYTIYVGDRHVYNFDYTITASGIGINNSYTGDSYWEKVDANQQVLDTGQSMNITEIGGGTYILDFNTESLSPGFYNVYFIIWKQNYAERTQSLSLTVSKRIFATSTADLYSVVSGNTLSIAISITDSLTGEPITDITPTDAYIIFEGQTWYFEYQDTGPNAGLYVTTIENIPSNAFFAPQTIIANIYINRDNYTTAEISVTINVAMIELIPGIPFFYLLVIIAAISIVVGSLGVYRYVQVMRIPAFVKKNKAMRKSISGKGKISDALIYPSKEREMVKLLGDKWEAIGLSLADIFGFPEKKRKSMPDMKDKDINKEGGES